jgi:hypothetical protein
MSTAEQRFRREKERSLKRGESASFFNSCLLNTMLCFWTPLWKLWRRSCSASCCCCFYSRVSAYCCCCIYSWVSPPLSNCEDMSFPSVHICGALLYCLVVFDTFSGTLLCKRCEDNVTKGRGPTTNIPIMSHLRDL